MATKRKASDKYVPKKDSPFWHPKVGDVLEGTFAGFGELRDGFCMDLQTKSGIVPVGMRKALQRIFKPLAVDDKLKIGKTRIKLEHTGTYKGSKGKPGMSFEVWVDGKKQDTTFARLTGKDAVSLFK